jgi:hypothetical protein
MTDTERIARLEAEVAALRELVEHLAFRGPTARGPDGKMIPIRDTMLTASSTKGLCMSCDAGSFALRWHDNKNGLGQWLCPACGERGK